MIENTPTFCERLYLSKPDVYIDNYSPQQHQIDVIRFLYRQYVKKNSGVTISESAECKSSLEVALFLSAILHLLKEPVLVLCEKSDLNLWAEHFRSNMQCFNDVAIEESNHCLKKKVFINSPDFLELFWRRSKWSILVIDNESFFKNKKIRNLYEADYKIWLTTLDVKTDLQSFSLIYEWFYPKDLNIEEIKSYLKIKKNKGDVSDMLTTNIRIEAILEDKVLRRTNISIPPNTIQDQPANRVRKRNKDATGTKIKRTKKLDVDNIDRPTVDKQSCTSISSAASIDNYDVNSYSNKVENHYSEIEVSIESDFNDRSNKDGDDVVNDKHSVEYKDNMDNNVTQCNLRVTSLGELDKDVAMDCDTSDVSQNCETDNIQLNYSEDNTTHGNTDQKNEMNDNETLMEIEHNTENNVIVNLKSEHPLDKDNSLHNAVNIKGNTSKQSIDDKLNELEEITLKKFKGSLLDRIF